MGIKDSCIVIKEIFVIEWIRFRQVMFNNVMLMFYNVMFM